MRLATEALLTGDAEIAEQVISADVEIDRARERVEDTLRAALAPAARSPATCGSSSPRCGWSASSSGWATSPCTSPRSPGCGCPTSPCPTRSGRPWSGWPRSPRTWSPGSPQIITEPRRRGRDRARPRRRGDGPAAPHQLRRAALRRLGPRRRGRRRHRAARPLLRADRRPRRLGRQPGRLRGHRPAPGRSSTAAGRACAVVRRRVAELGAGGPARRCQRPWLATAAAASAAASGSR